MISVDLSQIHMLVNLRENLQKCVIKLICHNNYNICILVFFSKSSSVRNQSINQPANQPTSQPINQPTNQPTNQPASQPTKHPTNQPTNQPAVKHWNVYYIQPETYLCSYL